MAVLKVKVNGEWQEIPAIVGPAGPQGIPGAQGDPGEQGIQGEAGKGIFSFEKTGTSGLTDTYRMTYTDGSWIDMQVSNGKGIRTIAKTGTSGNVDTYTITFNDNTTMTFTVTNANIDDTAGAGVTNKTWSANKLSQQSAEVTELKSTINKVYVPSANIYNRSTDRHSTHIDGNGVITTNAAYKASDYIYVGGGNKVTINVITGVERFFYYTTNDASGFSRALWATATGAKTIQLTDDEQYIVILMKESCADYMVNLGTTLLPYAPYGGSAGAFLGGVIDGIHNEIVTSAESVRNSSAQKEIVNLFDKSTITPGKYINVNTGGLETYDGFFASDFIYIGDLDSVTVSYTHIFGWYDANKAWLGHPDPMNSGSQDLTFTRPEGAVYLRFSAYNGNLNLAQIGEAVSRNNYVPYGIYKLPELRVNESQIEVSDDSRIIVDASGVGDYTSFTQAIYDTVDSGIDVLVKPGTYDIVAEYVALFGQSAVDSMADSDTAIFNGFQYGVRLRKRKVEFAPGAHLVCDWTGHTVDGTHRFSALGVDYDVEIIGLDLDVTGTFYCIHDDYGIATPYTVKYENCRVVGHNITNANCIGGGCKKYSRHILRNCYFDNNLTGSATVRYHNTNAEGAEPEIYVSNCYFNNWFTPRWYGVQTSKMKVYVNNCKARSIHKLQESASYTTDNVELYKWCNEESDPVT